ncbi:MAG: hypothetical protein GY846_00290 [Deltaproteobacteria bacterium]|nr:hypothetical protein [Deltaproteobacteria bacterium]
MASRRRKVQLKIAKKFSKRKKRKATIRREAALSSITNRLATAQALQAPLYECWERKGLFETDAGIGTVVVTRKTPGSQVLMAAFLVDVFCLGVKDAHCILLSENEYRFRLQQIENHQELSEVHPACAKKLVEGAKIYAESLGFSPHRDYGFAERIFGDIKENQCPRSFTFGRGGKPMYMAGPNDNAQFRKKVMNTLTTRLGKNGFHYLMPLNEPECKDC